MPDPLIGHDEIEGQNKNTPQRIQSAHDGARSGRYRWAYIFIPIGLVLIFVAMYSAMDRVNPKNIPHSGAEQAPKDAAP
jgi:hypothetical protein